MDAEKQMEKELARHIINTWGYEVVYRESFKPYIISLPALFRLYEFEEASHPDFKVFVEGLPTLIDNLGVEVIY